MDKIMITGNPVDGFTYRGPFPELTDQVARQFEDLGGDWWIADLHPTTHEPVEVTIPVEPTLPYKIHSRSSNDLIREAVNLVSEDNDNPEYDRALAELLTRYFGKGDGHIPQMAKYLRDAADFVNHPKTNGKLYFRS